MLIPFLPSFIARDYLRKRRACYRNLAGRSAFAFAWRGSFRLPPHLAVPAGRDMLP
ncbi:hypothetical protein CPT_Sonora_097 [Stenotrophomonas phage Sonora]|nr:hypothetical protein CPT_Sonora_097 [Stenotrophomonas phage Sonora]